MKTDLIIIQCKSNLHVGLGDSNYGVIDKLVQRDITDELPCIFSSSLKGAFREYFEEKLMQKDLADYIFGEGENKKSKGMDKGAFIFQQAFLLSIPLRSNQRPYYNAISPFIMEQLVEMASLFSYDFPPALKAEMENIIALKPADGKPMLLNASPALIIEDFEEFVSANIVIPELQKMIGSDIVILSENDIKRITDNYHLPVIARNKLDNGQSQNLWYEQVVPRESIFTTFVSFSPSKNLQGKVNENDFRDNVHEKMVQIGGDSSIGYGYCKVYSI
jgi:CRISPR-associated protein Cmr4